MPGFRVCNVKTESELPDKYPERCVSKTLREGEAKWQTLNKFIQDKAFEETDHLIVIAEGYLLNKQELFKKYEVASVIMLIEKMLQKCGEAFFSEFRGCFSGAVYIKSENKWIVYTNKIGDDPVFYLYAKGKFAAASQVNYLLAFCKEQNIELTFNESCAYQMLTYGYIATDETYANEIMRLHDGDYLVLQSDKH